MIGLKRLSPMLCFILMIAAIGCESNTPVAEKEKKQDAPTRRENNSDDSELPQSKINPDDASSKTVDSATSKSQKKAPVLTKPADDSVTINNAPTQEKQNPVVVDEETLNANGIKKLSSKHVVIYTDIRDSKDINQFTKVFEQAVEFWCKYFSIDKSKTDDWQVTVFVIENKEAFRRAGVLTSKLPKFATGYQKGNQIWIYLQRGNYYTRHLLLHEGTHAFMERFLGGYGPAWYAEGMAEMLAVHRWQDQKLKMNYRIRNKNETEYWGRVRIIQDDFKFQRALALNEVFRIDPKSFFQASRPYAWSWVACKFLDNHPLSSSAFKDLSKAVRKNQNQFNYELSVKLKESFDRLNADWKVYISELDYGANVAAAAMVDTKSTRDSANQNSYELKVNSQRGWHRTDIEIDGNSSVEVTASGRFQIKKEKNGRPWMSESNGVTIQYHNGRPLGQLLVAVDSELPGAKPVTAGQPLSFEKQGKLCLRINDSFAQMDDNQGELKVKIVIRKSDK